MPNINDYHAFTSTSSGSGGGGAGGSGCLPPGVIAILVILGILWLIGKLG